MCLRYCSFDSSVYMYWLFLFVIFFMYFTLLFFFFFFSSRRRHTRSDRDWSSDVCSSDLVVDADLAELVDDHGVFLAVRLGQDAVEQGGLAGAEIAGQHRDGDFLSCEIGRASCRERV